MKILVRYHDGAVPLTVLPQGDWIDLCAAETVTMHAGEFRIISLGVSMQLPEGLLIKKDIKAGNRQEAVI